MTLLLNGTNGVSDVDGSASTPAVRGTDANTGIFFPAADTIAFAEGGAEVARFDSSGNLGIGATSPNTKVQATVGSSGSGVVNALRLQNVGTSAGDGAKILFTAGTSTDGAGIASTGVALNSADLRFYSGGNNERMRISSGGNVSINSTGSTGTLTVNGNQYNVASFRVSSNGNVALQLLNASGTEVGYIQTNASSTTYATSSDYRLKENIVPMSGALAKVSALKPCTYTWKADGSSGEGFIAHELQEVVPDCVTGEKDGADEDGNPKYQGIDTSFLVATLTAAIQEQQAIITDLKSRIEALEQA
jgi:hypothetical protein